MVKEKEAKEKKNKKAPAKNLKEKRAAKAAKRAEKTNKSSFFELCCCNTLICFHSFQPGEDCLYCLCRTMI